jgi:hypothetical protein
MFAANADTTTPHDLVAASQRLLHAAHHEQRVAELFESLAGLEERVLAGLRDDQPAAKAFWLNVHGALVADGSHRDECRVAGTVLDSDAVRHGILRAGAWKYGLGYLPDPLLGRFERRHRLEDLDPRVHFATLAARHAPRLSGTYSATDVDAELADVTGAYLDATDRYDADAGVASVPSVFFWYRGDFGGRGGVREFLADHGAVPADATPRLSYASPEPDDADEPETRRRRERRQ